MAGVLNELAGIQVVSEVDGERYESALRRWSENAEKRAKYVVFPESAQDVARAVSISFIHVVWFSYLLDLMISQILYSTANHLEIAIKGGGHSWSGASSTEGGLVIDLSRMSKVTVDAQKKIVTAGGGAIWRAIDEALAQHGLATVGGTVNHTGTRFYQRTPFFVLT
jgi:FAD/FMN-containing dehydrogenase